MMTSSKISLACIALAIAATLVPTSAKADSYNVFTLDSDEARFFRGMDADGTVTLSYDIAVETTCPVGDPGCFRTYRNGVLVSTADTLPAMTTDNGDSCTPSVPGGATVLLGVCNKGYSAFMGSMPPGQNMPFLYAGSNLVDVLGSGTGSFLYMNSAGDVVWNDPTREFWYEAINTTSQVPEPGSLALLATGTLVAFGAIRRRLS